MQKLFSIYFYSNLFEKGMYWYNGKLIESKTLEIGIDDAGLLYGATVFTTLRVYDRSLNSAKTNWGGHCDRIRCSLETFGWQKPDWERVRQGAETLKAHFPVLRIAIFPDGREWIVGRNLPEDLSARQESGVVAWLAEAPKFRRSLAEHKTGNYLSAWLALREAQQYGAKEAILLDSSGNWLETSTGNLWGWQDGRWWTPPLEAGILPGLMRSQLIAGLKSQNKIVEEKPWSADLVAGFEAIAYSNSVVEVVPIHKIIKSEGESGRGGERGKLSDGPCPIPNGLSSSHICFQKLRESITDRLPFSQIG
ncbi:aminotransferase class IV [Aerosakkonema sp. BLCC-F183]|uniref:aminotransferase class IV n=1 Tax=Aerosakkonema sp. BLCC-F183 TaxID=3342834 RepID=UPI0035BBF639